MKLTLPTINSSAFYVDREFRDITADISDFGKGFDFSMLYDDACDVGLSVRGPDGKVSDWYLADVGYCPTDPSDLIGWTLKPTAETLRKYPGLKGYTMYIDND